MLFLHPETWVSSVFKRCSGVLIAIPMYAFFLSHSSLTWVGAGHWASSNPPHCLISFFLSGNWYESVPFHLGYFVLCLLSSPYVPRVKQKLSYCVSWKQIPEAGKNSASSYFDKYIRNINGVERSFPTSLRIFDHWS